MPVVAIINQKGGTGKTTLATNLAWVLAEKGHVLLLDADPQASAQNWAAGDGTTPDTLEIKEIGKGDLLRTVRSMASGYDWVIIDGPPGITKTSADAVRVADVVLIPAKPSPLEYGQPRTSWQRCRPARRPPRDCPKRPSSSLCPNHARVSDNKSTPLSTRWGYPYFKRGPPSAWRTPMPLTRATRSS